MTDSSIDPPAGLRAAIAADLGPVRRLRAPWARGLLLVPLAAISLVAAPLVFEFRDLAPLGWVWSWGASLVQLAAGLALGTAALSEAVPGRSWSRPWVTGLIALPVVLLAAIGLASWRLSPVTLNGQDLVVGLVCLVSSAVSALPVALVAVVLALGALPTRPAVTGWLAGLGAGLMADAGWRLFCHFSEPSHVLVAHLGGVVAAGAIGAFATTRLARH